MWYCYALFGILQEKGRKTGSDNFSYGPYDIPYGPYKICPTTQKVSTTEAQSLQDKAQAYGPYGFPYGP